MEQYIPKSVLVAEIGKKINEINLDSIEDWHYRLQMEHDIEVMKNILSIINTLEVKEVDSEKENLTPNDLSIIWTIINGLITELQLRINKWPGEKIFEEALKRFRAQQGER